MAACAKCSVLVENQGGIECSKCRQHFHPACIGLKPEALPRIAEDLKQGKYWLCQVLRGENITFSVYAHPELNRLKLDIVAEVQLSVQQTIAAVQLKADSTAEELGALRAKHEMNFLDLTKRVQALELDQSSHIRETSFKFDDVHRQLRRDEVVILRVPFKEGEELRNHFANILTALHLPREEFANVMLRRISRTDAQGAGRPRAYFTKKNLSLNDLGFPSGERVYINENLSAQNHAAFQQAMAWKREKKIHSVKVSDGMVFVHTSKESKSIRIFQGTVICNQKEPPMLFPKPGTLEGDSSG
ncbi:hypothetical protein quinque_006532 [Culex quinquefasciatus]